MSITGKRLSMKPNQDYPGMWFDIIIMLSIIGLTIVGGIGIYSHMDDFLSYVSLLIAVIGTFTSIKQVHPNLLKGFPGIHMNSWRMKPWVFRIISTVLLVVIVILQIIIIWPRLPIGPRPVEPSPSATSMSSSTVAPTPTSTAASLSTPIGASSSTAITNPTLPLPPAPTQAPSLPQIYTDPSYHWQADTTDHSCTYKNGNELHVIGNQSVKGIFCYYDIGQPLQNFAYEAHATIISGPGAGIAFKNKNVTTYAFVIYSGQYYLLYEGKTLSQGGISTTSSFVLKIAGCKGTLSLFVNGSQVGKLDNTPEMQTIGVMGYPGEQAADVDAAFQDAKVWTQPEGCPA
jgi:hypothetical protein